MRRRVGWLLLVSGLVGVGTAVAETTPQFSPGGYFSASYLASGQSLTPLLGNYPTAAPPSSMLQLAIAGKSRVICVNKPSPQLGAEYDSYAFIGYGKANVVAGVTQLACSSGRQDTRPDQGTWVFQHAANRPSMWLRSTSSVPEPRGAIQLGKQESSRRPLYACQFETGGATFVGYIGDDGLCYGGSPAKSDATASDYLVLVTNGTGANAQPNYGWKAASTSHSPHPPASHARLTASANIGGILNVKPEQRSLCRVTEGGTKWPGHLTGTACTYFTYFNNQTQRKEARVYEMLRVDPSKPKSAFVFGRHGGKSFYACFGAASLSAPVWGFTSDTGACTDGTTTTTKNVVIAQLPAEDTGA